ncbi:uncharacterized protein LOC119083278 [Bradysia coprophila]|uniref:uncharacterized protein LOC119083278 n=1 Tax=Bradysia coprophila TaxID=38358 RepID=UPI00187DABA7|nr:uncharacterized protein LOC119083278 [Bradysia coprophila]
MFKSFFGPFPDEPLLYSFDKILGLFHKFDSKLKCKDGEKQTDTAVSVVEKINEVCTETTTANDDVTVATGNDRTDATGNHTMDAAVTTDNGVTDVTVMEKISLELVENSSQTSKRSPVECITVLDSDKVNESIEPPQELKHISTPKSILKTTSSMECNFPLSRICITKKSVHSSPVSGTKRANRFTKCSTKTFTQTKGFGDSVTVVQDKIEKKLFRSDGRNRFESILKQETKHHNIQASRNTNNRMGRSGNQNHNELTSRPQKAIKNVKLKDRKVTKTEWAVTRIYTFDDDSQTYEVMKKDKVLDRNGGIERIFAMAPNLTTVAYNPLKRDDKKPKR